MLGRPARVEFASGLLLGEGGVGSGGAEGATPNGSACRPPSQILFPGREGPGRSPHGHGPHVRDITGPTP